MKKLAGHNAKSSVTQSSIIPQDHYGVIMFNMIKASCESLIYFEKPTGGCLYKYSNCLLNGSVD